MGGCGYCSTLTLSKVMVATLVILAISSSQLQLDTKSSLTYIEETWLLGLQGAGTSLGLKENQPKRRRAVLRIGGLVNEGLGSFLQHMKETVIFSICVDAELLVPESVSRSHKYSNSALYNNRVDWNTVRFEPPVCNVSQVMESIGGFKGLLSSCFGNGTTVSSPTIVANLTSHCGSFVHTVVGRELHQDLNPYVETWVRQRLPEPKGEWQEGYLRVGIHIRWGDLANMGGPGEPEAQRSISFENVTSFMAQIRACTERAQFKIFAEAMPEDLIHSRVPGVYDFVNAGHSWDNLAELASADVLLSGTSSFAVMAHLISDARLTVVSDPRNPKFKGLNRTDKIVTSVVEFVASPRYCNWIRSSPSSQLPLAAA